MPGLPKLLVAGLATFAAAGMLAGCDELPRDPEETTERVTGAVLRVGWIAGAQPTAVERVAVAGLAAALDAAVETDEGPAHLLIAELEQGRFHIIGGGLPKNTPFATRIGLTKPVGTMTLKGEAQDAVMAIRSGENRFLLRVNDAIARASR